jgi:DDE superfamily endonuclease/Homeodomain-like domain
MILPIRLYQLSQKGRVELWHVDVNPLWSSFLPRRSAVNWKPYNGARQSLLASPGVRAWFCYAPMAAPWQTWPVGLRWHLVWSRSGSNATANRGSAALAIKRARGVPRAFPPDVAVHLVKLACERPELCGRSLSQWDCTELARALVQSGVTESISPSTVRRILAHHKLKPWRHHMWLSPKHPRDATFYAQVTALITLYTRPLRPDEMVLSLDEKTSLQPRPRLHPTKPAHPGLPNRVEHEYRRDGALNLFAAFDTRTGRVYGQCHSRKRQREFLVFLASLEAEIPATIQTIHVVCDNVSTHHGKEVRQWLQSHPRFVFHFTPVHCSWMNQVEQWFSILQRKRFRIADFASKAVLQEQIDQFIAEWNRVAHPFNWSKKSVAKIMADAPAQAA